MVVSEEKPVESISKSLVEISTTTRDFSLGLAWIIDAIEDYS
jgi:hypothetical protein